jgi:hypothetical protein
MNECADKTEKKGARGDGCARPCIKSLERIIDRTIRSAWHPLAPAA